MPLRVEDVQKSNIRYLGAELTETMQPELRALSTLPAWLPDAVRYYIDHTEEGLSLRAIARRDGLHASTVLRQVRRYEGRRDDPLLDEALHSLAQGQGSRLTDPFRKETPPRSAPIRHAQLAVDEVLIRREGLRILRRLAEPGSVLAIAPDMEKAVVMREFPDGRTTRTGVVERNVAQAFALKDWIVIRKTGRVTSYEMTATGRSALKRMMDVEEAGRSGLADAATPFAAQHQEWGEREIGGDDRPRRMRYNLAESPVAILGRRRDKEGRVFLEADLVEAAERLREDFELAQMGPRVAQNWERFLTGAGDKGGFKTDNSGAEGPRAARDRVAFALRDLGPGLGDVALRVCCFLEGIEAAERRMGWAARSGKIVLRIALQRLKRHYDETYGKSGPLIG